MIKQKEITNIANIEKVPNRTIDKDWVLGHFLNAFYSFEENRKLFVFKGGTCLHKCYIENYRFSEDLDFTLLDEKFLVDRSYIQKIIRRAENESSIKFYISAIEKQNSNDIPQGYKIEIKFWGANHNPNQRPLPPSRWLDYIKLDISFSEQLFLPVVEKEIIHPYSDRELITSRATCYDLIESLAEKIRSLKQRNRPRDVYDVWYLSKMFDTDSFKDVKEILLKKLESKKLIINGVSDFVNNQKAVRDKDAWEKSLKHQLDFASLPSFGNIYEELLQFMNKLLCTKIMEKQLLSFDIKADFGMLKKPDTNDPVYLTFNMLHKPALLGILGAIVGLKGFTENGKSPCYYETFKDLKVSIMPLENERNGIKNHENGNFSKTIIKYNNSTGLASEETGGNLMVAEQTLVAPAFRCFVMLDLSVPEQKKLYDYILSYQAVYVPYLGKNECSLWWKNARKVQYDDSIPEGPFKINSLFIKQEPVKDCKMEESFFSLDMDAPEGNTFSYFENLPVAYSGAPLFQYEYRNFVYTDWSLSLKGKNAGNFVKTDRNGIIQLF